MIEGGKIKGVKIGGADPVYPFNSGSEAGQIQFFTNRLARGTTFTFPNTTVSKQYYFLLFGDNTTCQWGGQYSPYITSNGAVAANGSLNMGLQHNGSALHYWFFCTYIITPTTATTTVTIVIHTQTGSEYYRGVVVLIPVS